MATADIIPALSDQSLRALKARLATKLLKILDEVEPAPKTGHNKDQGYDYQSAKDIVSVTRKVMAKHGVMLTWVPDPNQLHWREYQSRSNNLQREVTVWYGATFTDAETGYEEIIPWPGAGVDAHDKSLAKAATAAMKSFLATQFQIGDENTDNDRSEEDSRSRGASRAQQRSDVWPKKIGGVLHKIESKDDGSYLVVKGVRFWAPWDGAPGLQVRSSVAWTGRFIEFEADMGKGPDGPCPMITKILAVPPGPLPKSVQEARLPPAAGRSAPSDVIQGHPDAKSGANAARTIPEAHDGQDTRSETNAPTGQEVFPSRRSGR
jgi:hypothetical protein